VHHKELKNAYQSEGIWNELSKNIQIQVLPNHLKKFIEEYILNQKTEISKKINSKDKLLFRATRNLLDRILSLCDAFNYKTNLSVNESTWAHDIIDPICRFISFDLSELMIVWDNVMSKATHEKNDADDGPIKKPDILGTYASMDRRYVWEMLYGEISNGPFANTNQSKIYKKEDRIKLEKFAKDSVNNTCKFYASNYSNLPFDF
ncbi:14396_t:CDS:2, partial [Gigaspora margarita]